MTAFTNILATENGDGGDTSGEPRLSKRAKEVLGGTAALIEKFTQLLSNQYSAENPDGIINFGVAENSLMQSELKKFLNSSLKLSDLDFTYGDSVAGSTRLFKALSNLMDTYFNPVTKVLPEHFITGAGVSAVVDQTIQVLCDEGEAVLIATPYYSGFDIDVTVRSKGILVGVDTGDIDPGSPETLKAFEAKIIELRQKGVIPRAVLLCNPHNPLGFNYPKETLLEYCRFCEKHNLHLLSDEIYALSQFKNDAVANPVPFISMLSIDVKKEADCHPGRVHVLYGMSKDWGSNGFRIGALVTQHNPQLHTAFLGTSMLMKVSSTADTLWSALLNDPKMLDSFVKTNQQRLTETFSHCRDFFNQHKIQFKQPQAAHFIFLNLNDYLRDEDDKGQKLTTPMERDTDLWTSFLNAGLFVAPGYMYHNTEPGWFRFTFCVRRDILDVGLKRFESVLEKHKKKAP